MQTVVIVAIIAVAVIGIGTFAYKKMKKSAN